MREFFDNLLVADFAARADGACSGWSWEMATASSVLNVIIALCYFALVVVVLLSRGIGFSARMAFPFVLFVATCAIGHLLVALTNFDPIYRVTLVMDGITALVSLWAAASFAMATRQLALLPRQELAAMRSELAEVRKQLKQE